MTIMLSFSNGDAIPFTSRFDSLEKAYGEAITKRIIEYDGKLYITTGIVMVGAV